MSNDLIKIKKKYGEEMMHMCAKFFPTILEYDGLLFSILSSLFAYSKCLYNDLVNSDRVEMFREYILSLASNTVNITETDKTPFELMDEAGYILYECKNEDDVKEFKKYYRGNESLCTFYSNRTVNHYVFFAVKKNVQEINRDEFSSPSREDLYGTSVISIQFLKGKTNFLSIKNRYNGTVYNPDATFSNNLENIIPGLTDSFQKMYHLNIFASECNFDLPGYCLGKNGKLYRYNYCINDIYYCSKNVIVTNKEVIEYEREKYIIADYFIIDLFNKEIRLFDRELEDAFAINYPINKIIVINTFFGKTINIYGNNFEIELNLDKYNRIISYTSNLEDIGDNFLSYNKTLKSFFASKLKNIGNDFLPRNDTLELMDIPNIVKVGNAFLEQNTKLKTIDFPLLKQVGIHFLRSTTITEVDLPSLEIAGDMFMGFNEDINRVSMPNLREVGDFFLNCNLKLPLVCFPSLEKVGNRFIARNRDINMIYLPNLKYIGSDFLENNDNVREIYLPKVLKVGNNFMNNNEEMNHIDLPNVIDIGDNFLSSNTEMKSMYLPNLIRCGSNFLPQAFDLLHYNLSSLEEYGNNFLELYNRKNKEKKLVKIK